MSGFLVIGIGNRFRGDDALGPLAADELKAKGLTVIEHSGEPAGLIEAWQGHERVILVDAVFSNAEPGTIHRFDLGSEKLPAEFARPTSHAVGVAEAVEFARVLNKLPGQIEFLGVEGATYDPGGELTPTVRESMYRVIEAILDMSGGNDA